VDKVVELEADDCVIGARRRAAAAFS